MTAPARPKRPAPSFSAIAAAAVGFLSVTAVAGLVRWSLWWPHDDMRQLWATFGAVVMAALGLAALAVALRSIAREWRPALMAFIAMAVLIGATAGFVILQSATERAL
jgi:hypothetical protein